MFLDDETGLLVTNLTDYNVTDGPAPSDEAPKDDEPLEHKLRRKRFEEDDTNVRGSNVKRTPENNFGWADKPSWMKYSGMVPGFVGKAGGLVDKGINANNGMAEAAARKHYGIEGESLGENAKETFKGADGFIGNVKVGDELVAISLSGEPLESGRPTLKPQQLDERIRTTGEQIAEATPEEVEVAEQEASVKYSGRREQDKSLFDRGFDQVAGIFDKKTSAAPSLHNVGTNPDSLNKAGFAGNIVGEDNEEEVEPTGVATADTAREAEPSQGGGFADLVPPGEPTTEGNLKFYHPDQTGLNPGMKAMAEKVAAQFGGLGITSGHRSATHGVEAGKARPGQHTGYRGPDGKLDPSGGNAIDVDMKGMDESQRAELVKAFIAQGATGIGTYGSMPDMLHVDRRRPEGQPVMFMHNKSSRDKHPDNFTQAPDWFKDVVAKTDAGEVRYTGSDLPPTVAQLPEANPLRSFASVNPSAQRMQTTQGQPTGHRTNTPNPQMGFPSTVDSAPPTEQKAEVAAPKPDEQVTAMARTIAGELGHNTIQSILSGDPAALESARSEIAAIVSTMNNRAGSSRYASLENPMLEGVLNPSDYNSLMKGNKAVTDQNYGLVKDFVNQAVMDAVSGALPSPAPKATHYRSAHMSEAPGWEKYAIDGTKPVGEHIFSTIAVPGTNRPEYDKAFKPNLPQEGPIVPDKGFNIPLSPPTPTANPNKVNRGAEMVRPIGFAQPEPNKPLNFPGPPPISRSPEYRRADDPDSELFDIEREPKMAPMGGYTGTQGVPGLRGYDKGPRNVPLSAMEEFRQSLPETDPFAGDEPFELPIDETDPDKISYSWDLADNVKKEAITPKNSIMAPPVPTPSQPGVQNKLDTKSLPSAFKESFAKPEEGLRPDLQNTRQASTMAPLGDIKGFGSTDKLEGGLLKDVIDRVVPGRIKSTAVRDPIKKESPHSPNTKSYGSGVSATSAVLSGSMPVGSVARSTGNPNVSLVSLPGHAVAHINDEFGWTETFPGNDLGEPGFHRGTQLAISPDGKSFKNVSPEKAAALANQGWSVYGKGATGKSASKSSVSVPGPSKSSGGFLGGLFGGRGETSSSSKSSSSTSRSGGFSSRGDLGSSTPGRSGGGDSEGKVLCGYFYGKGRIPKKILLADLKYAETMSEDTRKGYLVWAKPLVAFLEKRDSRILDNMIFPFTKGWVYEMAYKMGAHPKSSLWGRMVTNVGEFVCNKIGKFV